MEKGILEHATMTSRKHETVTVEEVRILGIELHEFLEKDI